MTEEQLKILVDAAVGKAVEDTTAAITEKYTDLIERSEVNIAALAKKNAKLLDEKKTLEGKTKESGRTGTPEEAAAQRAADALAAQLAKGDEREARAEGRDDRPRSAGRVALAVPRRRPGPGEVSRGP